MLRMRVPKNTPPHVGATPRDGQLTSDKRLTHGRVLPEPPDCFVSRTWWL